MKLAIIILLISGGCFLETGKKGDIQIRNNSRKMIDSIQLRINNYAFTIFNIPANQAVNHTFEKDSVIAKHDVWYWSKGFIKDSVIFEQWFGSNDLGFVPDSFKLKINDSLKLEEF